MVGQKALPALAVLALLSHALHAQTPSAAVPTSATSLPSSGNSGGHITLHWTDRGVGYWNRNLQMFDTFQSISDGGVTRVPASGQILMPMPALDQLPQTQEGWQALSDKIYAGIKERVQSTATGGNTDVEVLQVENVTLGQHVEGTLLDTPQADNIQQNNVRFAEAVGKAINRLQQDADFSAANGALAVDVYAGSNAGRTMPDAIVALDAEGQNPVNAGVKLVDSRGGLAQTEAMIEVLDPSKVSIYNTAGDAPAIPETIGGTTIADRYVAHQIKADFPEVHEYDIKPASDDSLSSLPGENHIMVMKSDSPSVLLQEYTGSGYTDPKFFLNPTQALINPDGSGLLEPPLLAQLSNSAAPDSTPTDPGTLLNLSPDAEVQISSEVVDNEPQSALTSPGVTIVDSGPLIRPEAPAGASRGTFWENLLQIGIVALQAYQAYEAAQPTRAPAARNQQTKSAAKAGGNQTKPCATPEQCAALQLARNTCSLRNDCSKWGGPPPQPPSTPGQGCSIQCTTSGPFMCWGNFGTPACPAH